MDFWLRLYTHCIFPSVALGTASLIFVDEAIYLEHNMSFNLKDDSDVYKQDEKCNTIVNVLGVNAIVPLSYELLTNTNNLP